MWTWITKSLTVRDIKIIIDELAVAAVAQDYCAGEVADMVEEAIMEADIEASGEN